MVQREAVAAGLVTLLVLPLLSALASPAAEPLLEGAEATTAALAGAVARALETQRAQADAAGVSLAVAGSGTPAGDLAAAVDMLLTRHGTDASLPPERVMRTLARLTPVQHAALGALMQANVRFEGAAMAAFPTGASEMPATGAILDARAGLLLAAVEFRGAFPDGLPDGLVLDVCPAFALDLAGVDNTYRTDCALIVDLGGDDAYENNAGGTGRRGLPSPTLPGIMSLPDWALTGFAAAAVLDFAGDDAYGDPENVRSGAMGGGSYGAGFLLDAAGDDSYGRMDFTEVSVGDHQVCARSTAGNVRCAAQSVLASASELAPYDGGDAVGLDAEHGVTCILKTSGDVDCRAADELAETLDYLGGDATQVRVGRYHRCVLTEGGDVRCTGVSRFGIDPYGGAIPDYTGGDAIGLDLSDEHLCILVASGNVLCRGDNRYGQSEPYSGGDATQVDVGFHVTCVRTTQGTALCHGRTNYTDTAGDVVQVATGGFDFVCVRTSAGTVRCPDGSYAWGDALGLDVGFFLDAPCVITGFGTADCFSRVRDYPRPDFAQTLAVNGGGSLGAGFLLDRDGNDTYVAGRAGTNGGVDGAGFGLLLDLGGDDHYRADLDGGNGGAGERALACVPIPDLDPQPINPCASVAGPKFGLLLDGGGHDHYEDRVITCWDCTVVPKGLVGAQVDEAG